MYWLLNNLVGCSLRGCSLHVHYSLTDNIYRVPEKRGLQSYPTFSCWAIPLRTVSNGSKRRARFKAANTSCHIFHRLSRAGLPGGSAARSSTPGRQVSLSYTPRGPAAQPATPVPRAGGSPWLPMAPRGSLWLPAPRKPRRCLVVGAAGAARCLDVSRRRCRLPERRPPAP